MMLVVLAKRSQMLQPLVDVLDQPTFVVVNIHSRGDVHGGNQHHAFLHSTSADNFFHLRREVDIGAMRLGMELQVLGQSLHQRSVSATFPLAISVAILAKSSYITRSFSIVGQTERIAACAACPRFEVLSGARKSIAWATAMASIARTL